MTVTVTVDATYRMARMEITAPFAPTGMVVGHVEVLLEEPSAPDPETAKLRASLPSTRGDKDKTLGVMPAQSINRVISDVLPQTVDVEGNVVTFASVMQAMALFFEKWRQEDDETRPQAMASGGEPTPVKPVMPAPDHKVPPPIKP